MAYANSAGPDQTARIRVLSVCLSSEYFKKQLHKKQTSSHREVQNKVFEILGHLLYSGLAVQRGG